MQPVSDNGIMVQLRQKACLWQDSAAAHSALSRLAGPAIKSEFLPYPGSETNPAATYELLGLTPDCRPALRRFADEPLTKETFSAAPTLRFYLRNRLDGVFVGDYLRYLRSIVDCAPMLEPAQLKTAEKAIFFELEQLRGYRQFFGTYKGTPFARGVSAEAVLDIGLLAALSGNFSSARTAPRMALAERVFEYLKRIPLAEVAKALVCGHRQKKVTRDVLDDLSRHHKRDFSRLLWLRRPVPDDVMKDFLAGKQV